MKTTPPDLPGATKRSAKAPLLISVGLLLLLFFAKLRLDGNSLGFAIGYAIGGPLAIGLVGLVVGLISKKRYAAPMTIAILIALSGVGNLANRGKYNQAERGYAAIIDQDIEDLGRQLSEFSTAHDPQRPETYDLDRLRSSLALLANAGRSAESLLEELDTGERFRDAAMAADLSEEQQTELWQANRNDPNRAVMRRVLERTQDLILGYTECLAILVEHPDDWLLRGGQLVLGNDLPSETKTRYEATVERCERLEREISQLELEYR